MRALILPCLLALCACATPPTTEPREYLDEQTAATIKVVADPLVFAQDAAAPVRDFLNVYAIDVNRMGAHAQYLAVLQWWPANPAAQPKLQLDLGEQALVLDATSQSAREIGIGQSLDPAAPRDGRWRFYPVTKEQLATVARAKPVSAALVEGEQRVIYGLWRDGRSQLAELTDDLP